MIGKHLGFITEVNKIQHINSIGFGVEIEIKSMVRAMQDQRIRLTECGRFVRQFGCCIEFTRNKITRLLSYRWWQLLKLAVWDRQLSGLSSLAPQQIAMAAAPATLIYV